MRRKCVSYCFLQQFLYSNQLKNYSRHSQNRPIANSRQRAAKTCPEPPRSRPEPPRAAQSRPRAVQSRPRAAQEPPQRRPRALRAASPKPDYFGLLAALRVLNPENDDSFTVPDSLQTAQDLPQKAPDRPKTGSRQAQVTSRQPKTGPRQAKTGSISKPKTLKRHLLVKVFGISGISKENPRPRQPPDKSRDAKTAEDRPKTAPRRPQHSPGQDQAAQDRPSTAHDRPKTSQDRLHFEAKNLEQKHWLKLKSLFGTILKKTCEQTHGDSNEMVSHDSR